MWTCIIICSRIPNKAHPPWSAPDRISPFGWGSPWVTTTPAWKDFKVSRRSVQHYTVIIIIYAVMLRYTWRHKLKLFEKKLESFSIPNHSPSPHSSAVAFSLCRRRSSHPSLRLAAMPTETTLHSYRRCDPSLRPARRARATGATLLVRGPRYTAKFKEWEREVWQKASGNGAKIGSSLRFYGWISSSESLNGVVGRTEVLSGRFQRLLQNLDCTWWHLSLSQVCSVCCALFGVIPRVRVKFTADRFHIPIPILPTWRPVCCVWQFADIWR